MPLTQTAPLLKEMAGETATAEEMAEANGITVLTGPAADSKMGSPTDDGRQSCCGITGGTPCIRVYRKENTGSAGKAALPRYATEGAAGADVEAFIPQEITINSGERKKVPTGLILEIPAGWEAQVRPRSGLALKHGITVLNTPGTIDSDYRGELEIILVNLGKEPYTVHSGDRIAQLVFAPAPQVNLEAAEELANTERGEGGFGSTGIGGNTGLSTA